MAAMLILMWLAVGLLNLAVVLAARKATAWTLRIEGVRWLPWRTPPGHERLARWKQATFVLSGALACYAVAGVTFTLSLLFSGRAPGPGEATTTVNVMPGLPAARAGVQDGDRIVELAGTPVEQWSDLPPAVSAHAGERVELVVQRAGERVHLEVQLSAGGKLGVEARLEPRPVGLTEALTHGMTRPVAVLVGTARGLYLLLVGGIEEQLGGPVMIVHEAGRPSLSRSRLALFGLQDTYYGLPFGLVLAVLTRVKRVPKRREAPPTEG